MRFLALVILVNGLAGLGYAQAPEDREAPAVPSSASAIEGVAVPEATETALRYYRTSGWWWFVWRTWEILVPAVILFSGFSARMRHWAWKIGRKWFFVVAVYVTMYALLAWLAETPLAYFSGYLRGHAYGLSNQSLGRWLANSLIRLGVTVVAGAAFLWLPYLLIAKSPRRWWLYCGALAVPFMFFVAAIAPVWILPLFNDFGPMADKELEAKILALADRAGIEGSRVYEVDKSIDTSAMNAYVAGFLNTKRIVLWDTLLENLEDDEVLFVMGHEMAHYVLGHVTTTILVIGGLLFVALYFVYRLGGAMARRFQGRFGFSELSDIASLPLLLLVGRVATLALAPLALAFSRYNEHEADRFGLELTRLNRPAATAFVKLQHTNLGHPRPGPWYRIFRGTHPSVADRIAFFNAYRPWERSEPLTYEGYFRSSESR